MRPLIRGARELPACYMTGDFWQRVRAELDRVQPLEGVAVPLVSLELRRPDPCARIGLEDIRSVTLAAALIVPGHLQVNERLRVHVTSGTDERLNASMRKVLKRFPRLRTGALLHSHPFARGATFPSRGPAGDYEGHMLPLLERNREAGLETSFSFIACRESRGPGWRLEAFALDDEERIVALGAVEVVEDGHRAVREAFDAGTRRGGPAWLRVRRLARQLRKCEIRHSVDELMGGWLRLIAHPAPGRATVHLLPPCYPLEPEQSFDIRHATVQRRAP